MSEPEKIFKCPTCARQFNKKANLKVHSRKHTGEKPYACSKPGCGRSFMWKSSVTFHEQNCPSIKRANDGGGVVTKGVQKRPKGGGGGVGGNGGGGGGGGGGGAAVSGGSGKGKRKSGGEGDGKREGGKGVANGGMGFSPPPVHTLFGEGEGGGGAPNANGTGVLPAPATLLGEKRLSSGGGKPPTIPGVRGLYSLPKDNGGGKMLFDLRVPTSSGGVKSNGALYAGKMPKIPIAMELDDSDDETSDKIVGAQDAFMRTGNPFGGFAPPTRCSPLPISSPIVCPGISPMPLSPLAPFSPLPPDSPAHNAPNPVHPPLNQMRPNSRGW